MRVTHETPNVRWLNRGRNFQPEPFSKIREMRKYRSKHRIRILCCDLYPLKHWCYYFKANRFYGYIEQNGVPSSRKSSTKCGRANGCFCLTKGVSNSLLRTTCHEAFA